MVIVLSGFQGVGKTKFGRKAAELLQRPFFDIDELLLKKYPVGNIRVLFESLGRERFRKEEESLFCAIVQEKKSVIALGGGSLESERLQKIAKNMCVLYLYEPLINAQKRILISTPPYVVKITVEQFILERHDVYMKTCSSLIPCALLSEEEIVLRIQSYGE